MAVLVGLPRIAFESGMIDPASLLLALPWNTFDSGITVAAVSVPSVLSLEEEYMLSCLPVDEARGSRGAVPTSWDPCRFSSKTAES